MHLVYGVLHSTNGSWLMSLPNSVLAPYPVSCMSEVSGPCQTLPIWTMPVGRCSSCSWRGSSLARCSCEDISQPCPQGWCESLLKTLKVFIHKIKIQFKKPTKEKAKIHSCCLRRVLGWFSFCFVLIMPLDNCIQSAYTFGMAITLQDPSAYQLSHCIAVLPCGTWQIAPANCSIHSVAFQKPSVSRKTQRPTVGSEDQRLNTVWLWSVQW